MADFYNVYSKAETLQWRRISSKFSNARIFHLKKFHNNYIKCNKCLVHCNEYLWRVRLWYFRTKIRVFFAPGSSFIQFILSYRRQSGLVRAWCDTDPRIWGNRSLFASQSKVGYKKHTLCKYEPVCVMRDRWYPRGWDIGPTFDGPLPRPSLMPDPMGMPQRATSIHK